MNRYRLIASAVALVALVIAGVWLAFDYRVHPHLTAGPMVQMVTTEGFTLIWRMYPRQPITVHLLADDGTPIRQIEARREGQHRNQYAAVVDRLAPGRRYRYQLVCRLPSGEQRTLAEYRTRTAPPAGRAFRFLAFGDGGAGAPPARRLARRMTDYEPDLIIHTGDIISPDGAPEDFYAKFYQPYAHLICQVPLYPCLGNHEFRASRGQPLLDAFVLPRNGPEGQDPERHYWFDFGDARFVAIDCNHDYPLFRDIVAPWLDGVLNTAGDRWKIVFFHEPVFTNGKYEPADKLLESVVPVFDRHRVELVLVGHNHMYERTYPIRYGKPVPDGEGTVYVTTAAGGNNLYEARRPPPTFMAAWCDSQHSFTVADVTPDTLTLRQIGADGRVIDEHHITRRPPAGPADHPASVSSSGT